MMALILEALTVFGQTYGPDSMSPELEEQMIIDRRMTEEGEFMPPAFEEPSPLGEIERQEEPFYDGEESNRDLSDEYFGSEEYGD